MRRVAAKKSSMEGRATNDKNGGPAVRLFFTFMGTGPKLFSDRDAGFFVVLQGTRMIWDLDARGHFL